MLRSKFLRRRSKLLALAAGRVLLGLLSITLMEVRRLDLTVKVNFLATCAAFVFVGAILLGAF